MTNITRRSPKIPTHFVINGMAYPLPGVALENNAAIDRTGGVTGENVTDTETFANVSVFSQPTQSFENVSVAEQPSTELPTV